MKIEIKKVRECGNKAYGNYMLRGRNSALITISLKKNPTLADYGTTLLHEMLHAYMTLMRKEGFKITNKKEHAFIYAVEDNILEAMRQFCKRKEK